MMAQATQIGLYLLFQQDLSIGFHLLRSLYNMFDKLTLSCE